MIVNEVDKPLKELEEKYVKQLNIFLDYLNRLPKVKLATLGPRGTSSEATEEYLLSLLNHKGAECYVYPSYESAMKSVVTRKNDLLLIANAYNKIDQVYMCPDLKLLASFEHPTPYYGLAKKKGYKLPTNRVLKLATHHAPVSLIPYFMDEKSIKYEIILVDSTSRAAIDTQQGTYDLCVTNSNSVQEYNLEFISETRPIFMLWSVFGHC